MPDIAIWSHCNMYLRWIENEADQVGHPHCPPNDKRYGKSRTELPQVNSCVLSIGRPTKGWKRREWRVLEGVFLQNRQRNENFSLVERQGCSPKKQFIVKFLQNCSNCRGCWGNLLFVFYQAVVSNFFSFLFARRPRRFRRKFIFLRNE